MTKKIRISLEYDKDRDFPTLIEIFLSKEGLGGKKTFFPREKENNNPLTAGEAQELLKEFKREVKEAKSFITKERAKELKGNLEEIMMTLPEKHRPDTYFGIPKAINKWFSEILEREERKVKDL